MSIARSRDDLREMTDCVGRTSNKVTLLDVESTQPEQLVPHEDWLSGAFAAPCAETWSAPQPVHRASSSRAIRPRWHTTCGTAAAHGRSERRVNYARAG